MQTMTVMNAPLVIRPITALDLTAATELSVDQQWPHRKEDWEMFLQMGEGLVAERDGKLIGTTLAWRYGADMATIGMVIVCPSAQGQGIGKQLMEEMIARLGNRTIVLNATKEGVPLYKKLEFIETGRIHQHQGQVKDVPLAELGHGDRIRPRGRADSSLPVLYCAASGMDRQELFQGLAGHSRTVVYTRDHAPVGFAMVRRFGWGWSIAPVVAPDAASAKALILHWLAVKQGSFCRIDVTADSELSGWLETLGMPHVGSVHTMARGPSPVPASGAKIFAIAAQALG